MTRPLRTALALCLTLAVTGYAEAQTRDGKLGSSCGGDEDCTDGLMCLISDPTVSGFPGGACSAFCASDLDCAAYSESALCVGICFETCERDLSSGSEWDSGKCHGRTDVACTAVACADDLCTTPITACVPFCSEDDQCGEGLFCDQARAQCQPTPREGDAPGAPCDPASTDFTCNGICDLDIEGSLRAQSQGLLVFLGICEESCILGAPDSCADPEPGPERVCLGALGNDALSGWATGTGDLGICLTLCNCTSDCRGDQVCLPWDSGGAYDSAGICQRGHQPRGVADCLPLGSGGATGEPSTGCKYGAVRACKVVDGCLGTAECQSDGTYADCHCIDDQEGAGGAGDSAKPTLADDASGCSCRMSGKRSPAVGIILLALFVSVLRRVLAPRRR